MTEFFLERAAPLHFQIWSEFEAMPGLRLTLKQACRLIGGKPTDVMAALRDLIDASVLRQIGPYYVRADLGHRA